MGLVWHPCQLLGSVLLTQCYRDRDTFMFPLVTSQHQCGVGGSITKLPCYVLHGMAINIYLPSVGVLLKGHNKWW